MKTRHCHVIVNPRGGRHRGIAIWERVRPIFDEAGWDLAVSVTEYSVTLTARSHPAWSKTGRTCSRIAIPRCLPPRGLTIA